MSRLKPEQEAEIRSSYNSQAPYAHWVRSLLDEITELRRERDEAIVGARAALEAAKPCLEDWMRTTGWGAIHKRDSAALNLVNAALALTPQSALDAVEHDRRELIWTAIEMQRNDDCDYVSGNIEPCGDKEYRIDRVIAKVKRA